MMITLSNGGNIVRIQIIMRAQCLVDQTPDGGAATDKNLEAKVERLRDREERYEGLRNTQNSNLHRCALRSGPSGSGLFTASHRLVFTPVDSCCSIRRYASKVSTTASIPVSTYIQSTFSCIDHRVSFFFVINRQS